MHGRRNGHLRWLGASLLLGAVSCASTDDGSSHEVQGPPTSAAQAALVRASDCSDLLTKIQNDSIAKVQLIVERAKARAALRIAMGGDAGGPGMVFDAGVAVGVPSGTGGAPTTSAPPRDADDGDFSSPESPSPIGASDTNRQVADVDEADFVKVVESGRGIFLLHGSTLQKLKSWPAAETALVGTPLTIEGTPSEMFVTDEGQAIVFSTVSTYGGVKPPYYAGDDVAVDCAPEYCKGYGSSKLKITVADVSGATPRVERELYYEGWYVSSRRYDAAGGDVVRAVVQANSKFAGLYEPQVTWYDAWQRPYGEEEIASQLDEWARRTTAAIEKTTLDDWLPTAEERKDGSLAPLARQCGDYYVPSAGLSDYGLTQVVSLDVANPSAPVGGVTIVGATSTVYSNRERLVLAQPDYRWSGSMDLGASSLQQTALHLFEIAAADTRYVASGFVPGQLPLRNAQFGLDVAADGTIRAVTTGAVRNDPAALPEEPRFWMQHTENQVVTARASGGQLAIVGKSAKLGHEGESVYSARFVGNRAYVVTFRQTDPLIVVDVSKAESPTVLGELEIPGFSEYMHPLDENHLLTAGQSASRGMQLQIFDVSNPAALPAPKVFEFEPGSSSQVSYDHKAFTFFEGVLAMPVYGYGYGIGSGGRYGYRSALELVRVDARAGFTHLGSVDHAALYADNGSGVICGYCDAMGCYDYRCAYAPEVRRGHFVKSDSKTYVYSFSYAGVLVNDLGDLRVPVAKVGLPAPSLSDGGVAVRDGGVAVPAVDAGVGMPRPSSDGGSTQVGEYDAGAPSDVVAADAGVDLPTMR